MRKPLTVKTLALVLSLTCLTAVGQGGPRVPRSRSLRDSASQRAKSLQDYARDMQRDKGKKPKQLARGRTFQRFTSYNQALREQKLGLAPGAHMASRPPLGRPLSAREAQRRYGLKNKPSARETIQLPKGRSVKLNKVIGGERAFGETTSPRTIARRRIVDIRRVR